MNRKPDRHWHHFCFKWENSFGRWEAWLDGARAAAQASGFAKGYVIAPGGPLLLGQSQYTSWGTPVLEGNSTHAFAGDLSDVNMWDKDLSGDEIYRMSKHCHSMKGNVFKWSDFKGDSIIGVAKVVRPSSCKHAPCYCNS